MHQNNSNHTGDPASTAQSDPNQALIAATHSGFAIGAACESVPDFTEDAYQTCDFITAVMETRTLTQDEYFTWMDVRQNILNLLSTYISTKGPLAKRLVHRRLYYALRHVSTTILPYYSNKAVSDFMSDTISKYLHATATARISHELLPPTMANGNEPLPENKIYTVEYTTEGSTIPQTDTFTSASAQLLRQGLTAKGWTVLNVYPPDSD
jgi:hypothetical protein